DDFPTPGSPASRTTAPGTSPSPSTRSSSPTPVRARVARSALTSRIGTALLTGVDDLTWASFGAPSSTTLPQVWHSPQRPTQRTVVQPHSVHLCVGRVLAFTMPAT